MPTMIEFEPDARRGCMKSGKLVLSATPNTVTTVVVPATAKGFRLYPSADIRYNINAAPAAVTDVATTDQDAVSSDEYDGGWAIGALWDVRLLEAYNAANFATRTLHIMSATASATVHFEFF